MLIEGQSSCAENTGVVAELSLHEPHIPATGERFTLDDLGGTLHKEVARLTDATANHDELGIEQVHDAHERLSEHVTSIQKDLSRDIIP